MAGFGRICSTASNCLSLISSRSVIPKFQQCATMKGKAAMRENLEKFGIPPKPKKPMSIFLRFLKQERIKSEYADSSMPEKEKIQSMAKKWASFDTEQKEAFRREYDLEMLAYTKQLMTYEQSITPEQKKLLADSQVLEKEKSEKFKQKKRLSELGKPKRPPTGFLQFLQEHKYSTRGENNKRKDFVKEMANEWNAMTTEEKAKYKMESSRLMVQYKQDMREWEENMVKRGHFDVVRNRGLMDMKTNNQPSSNQ